VSSADSRSAGGFIALLALPGIGLLVLIVWIAGIDASTIGDMLSSDTSEGQTPPQADIELGDFPDIAQPCQLEKEEQQEACIDAKTYAYQLLLNDDEVINDTTIKNPDEEFKCLDQLWIGESNWNAWAYNPNTTPSGNARGIPQIMDELYPEVKEWDGDWKKQVDWGYNYIRNRDDYGTPCRALEKWNSRDPHWY